MKTQILAALNWLKERTSESAALQAYPIGSIYMSTNATSPQTLFGGTWRALDQGRVLIGANASHPAGSTGGAETHVITTQELPRHNHTASTNSTGSHSHTISTNSGWTSGNNICGVADGGSHGNKTTNKTGAHSHTVTVNNAGSSAAMSLMQPYLAVYMWERTA